jgi:hypothetical protein
MKHLLNGVAIAALLAIAAPVWAQGTAPTAPAASTPSTTSATPPMHRHARAHHHASHATHGRMAHGSPSVANQLNRAELSRLQTGAPPSSPPAH